MLTTRNAIMDATCKEPSGDIGKPLFKETKSATMNILKKYNFFLIRKWHSFIRNNISQGVCTTEEQRFATVQVRVSTNKNVENAWSKLTGTAMQRHESIWAETCRM